MAAITSADVLIQLNTDFSLKGMSSQDLRAVVAAWQAGALSRDTMFELFRRGEILRDGRTNEDEAQLIQMRSAGQAGLATRGVRIGSTNGPALGVSRSLLQRA